MAQNWVQGGATWTFNYTEFNGTGIGYTQYSYQKDTTIGLQPCQLISGFNNVASGFPNPTTHITYAPPIFTFQRNDTVFFYSHYESIFKPTYFWGTKVGDTINYKEPSQPHCPFDSILQYLIEDTTSVIINGITLRSYRARVINFNSSFLYPDTIRIIERIGCTQFIKPFHTCYFDDEGYSLRCYQDNTFALYQPDPQISCNYVLGIKDETHSQKFNLSPNPANSFLFINNNTTVHFEIRNVFGQTVLENILPATLPINIAQLPTGLFFLQIQYLNSVYAPTIKFIKN